ncbi:MAG: ribosome maturation factor RimP [Alphaproteobacteria bacterium]|nr:ribosome maturation factor RimP [Alphaproteobacteria bacterium]
MVAIVEPALAAQGLELVRVAVQGHGRPVLLIMIGRSDEADVAMDDCVAASRTVSTLLDVADPMPGEYRLEVSSPGLDRPLTRAGDFARYAGHDARVEMREAVDGQRRFRGRLEGIDGDVVTLTTEAGPVSLPFAGIIRAKLILTNALLAQPQKPAAGQQAMQGS